MRSSARRSPGMAKSMVFVPPVAALESRMAWRSEPGPLSAVVVTRKTPSVMRNWAWTGLAPSDWASRLSVGEPSKPDGGAVYVNPSSAAFSAESGPV